MASITMRSASSRIEARPDKTSSYYGDIGARVGPPPLQLKFQVKWRPPKGRDVRLFVVGSIPELGQVKIRLKNIKSRFDQAVQAGFQKWWLAREQRRTRQVARSELSDSDDSSSDHSDGVDWSRLDQSTAVDMYLDSTFHLLNPDEELGIEDLYTTENIQIKTVAPGDLFSYAFVVWRLDTNSLWDFEVFAEARWMQVPEYVPHRNPRHMFIVRCERLHDRRDVIKDNLGDMEDTRVSRNPCEPSDSDEDYD